MSEDYTGDIITLNNDLMMGNLDKLNRILSQNKETINVGGIMINKTALNSET